MAAGSAIWGDVASRVGLSTAHLIAAGGALLAIPLTRRWQLQTGAAKDLSPSLAWPAPITVHDVQPDRGPVMVAIEYQIDPRDREAFLTAIAKLAHERHRDGAYDWRVFEDPSREGRFVETFLTDSWLDHLRQHERVTVAASALHAAVDHFQTTGIPKVTHLVAASGTGS